MPFQTDPAIAESQQRIRLAFDPSLLKSAGEAMARKLGTHLAAVQASQGRVLNWADPRENIARAASWTDGVGPETDPAWLIARFETLVGEILGRGHNLHDPRYVGHQVPAPVPLAGLFDAVGSVTNQVMAVYDMGPWSTAVELAMVGKLAGYLGWTEGDYAGLVTHGATLANLNALLAARNIRLPGCWEAGFMQQDQPVLIVQADAHYSIARAAGILGLGTRQVIKVSVDERRRMNVAHLKEILQARQSQGQPIIAVVACACSTPTGAFDPLPEIADACEQHEVWLHVDAAHGGSALLSERHRHLVAGLERADSLVWDAHKMLFVPALCAFLFFKRKADSYQAFQQDAPYLFDPTAPGLAEFDLGLRTMECTKRAASFGLWGVWSMFGPQLFADMIDTTFGLGQLFYDKLRAAPDFEPLHEPQCNIVAFQHLPDEVRNMTSAAQGDFQRKLRRKTIESGEFYLVATNLNGTDALRVTIINPLTTADHLDRLLQTLRRIGREVLSLDSPPG